MPWKVPADLFDKFDEALEFFRRRVPMPAEQFYALGAEAREKAFTVSDVAQQDVVQDVLDSIEKALEQGTDLKSWKRDIAGKLQEAWQGKVSEPGWRLDTIFRTNIQTANSHGRVRQMEHPDVLKLRPFRLYDATRDQRTTDICRKRHKVLLPADDPWWNDNTPPLHFNCRSLLRSLRERQAKRRGGIKRPPASTPPGGEGFGRAPNLTRQVEPPKPSERKRDRTLQAIAKRKERQRRPKAPPPPPKSEHTPEHWEAEFRSRGHTEGVARTLAVARAAHERGLDRPAASVRKSIQMLAKLQMEAAADSEFYWPVTMPTPKRGTTVRELVASLRDEGQTYQANSIEAIAALIEHSESIPRGHKVRLSGRPSPGPARTAHQRAERFFELFGHRDLRYPTADRSYAIHWSSQAERAYQNSVTRTIVVSQRRAGRRNASLEHECGHALEHLNERLAVRAREFLARRTRGELLYQLRELDSCRSWDEDEVARPDKFLDPYMGKDYRDGATEITSMGLELIARGHAHELLEKDPEYFWFVLGQLAAP